MPGKVKVKEEVDDEPTTSKSSGKGKAEKSGGKKGKSGKEENDTEEKEVGKGFLAHLAIGHVSFCHG